MRNFVTGFVLFGTIGPHQNNALSKMAERRGLHKLDLVGLTGGIPISRHSPLQFELDKPAAVVLKTFNLPPRYVTLHHGSDKNMADARGLSTKNLPVSAWAQVVTGLKEHGIKTVQLGAEAEQLIPGIDLDLRGRTSLVETAAVLQYADCHADTEGGLVHLARAVGKRSVVAFGPTSTSFFGYPENINIAPKECGDCWWSKRDWATNCPLGFADAICMTGHSATKIVDHILEVAELYNGRIEIKRISYEKNDSDFAVRVRPFTERINELDVRSVLLLSYGRENTLVGKQLLSSTKAEPYCLLAPDAVVPPEDRDADLRYVCRHSLPILDRSVDVLMAVFEAEGPLFSTGLTEALRVLKVGGVANIGIHYSTGVEQKPIEAEICEAFLAAGCVVDRSRVNAESMPDGGMLNLIVTREQHV